MNLDPLYSELTIKTKAKIALLVLDGVGDIATAENGFLTPLEAAKTPNMDCLAKVGALGRMIPTAPGITPGSGPGHIALFGYDPVNVQVGRGVIEALGLGIELHHGDVAARANFCTLDKKGLICDRRAGRTFVDLYKENCAKLSTIKKIEDIQVAISTKPRAPLCARVARTGTGGPVTATDPGHEGMGILESKPENPQSSGQQKTARIINEFYRQALPLLDPAQRLTGFFCAAFPHSLISNSSKSATSSSLRHWLSIRCTKALRNLSA